MVDYTELRRILNKGTSVKHFKNTHAKVVDSHSFRPLSASAFEDAFSLTAQAHKDDTASFARRADIPLCSIKDAQNRANESVGIVMDCLQGSKPKDAEDMHRTFQRDAIVNGGWNIGTPKDPTMRQGALPNIYISPIEASSLYSQKGIFETIINKKSKSILLNGFSIENPRLSEKQIDKVKEKCEVLGIKNLIADAVTTSLVYGGSLLFPMFKHDTPVTTGLPLSSLLRLGLLKKDCLDYFVTLDRWQTFIIPPYNPTQKDFLMPDYFTIPFLGSDVHHTRCARVVTAKQTGYWGQVINQGWGISDFCGYVQSGLNYKVAVQSIPLMIQQMSILARVINVDGVLATEGSNALDALVEANTIHTREASPDNPVTMDVMGDIKSINRNFAQVPELIRLLRQDLASDAVLPEPLLFSSEKGNFASGDDTQGNLYKQNEAIQLLHKELELQFRQIAKILLIDSLGTTNEVMEALPYTSVHFDQPVVANALERAQIGKFFSENVFNLVSSRIPIDIAVKMAQEHIAKDMAVSSDIIKTLEEVQKKADKNDELNQKLDAEQKEADIEQTEKQTEMQGVMQVSSGGSSSGGSSAKSAMEIRNEKLSSNPAERNVERREQKKSEKVRLGSAKRSEKEARQKNKRV